MAVRVLFVCMGNICRSPTAEGVMRRMLAEAGMEDAVEIDSAGTGGWHVGHPPDPRSVAAAAARGTVIEGSARQVRPGDFDAFDLILVADRDNLRDVEAIAPPHARAQVRLLRAYDPRAVAEGDLEVPDPYYGAEGGFDEVLDLVERACAGLLEELRARS